MRLDWLFLVVVKEFRQVARNKRVLIISLMLPAFLMALVGYAFSGEIKNVALAIVDEDMTPTSMSFTNRLQFVGAFHVTHMALDRNQAETLIRDGKVKAAVIVPRGFESDLRVGQGQVYLILDGSDPVVAGVAGSALDAAARAFSPGIRLNITSLIMFNPKLRYLDFLAPSMVGLIVQFLPTFLMAISLAGEKERGTIEQLVVTPIGGFEILLGKMVAYVIIGTVEAAVALGVAVALFGLHIRGSIMLVALIMLVFTIASVSVGTLSSVFAKNQIQAIQQVIPIIYVSIFLSGVFYPLESMPAALRPATFLVPLTYMNHALRALITKGAGLEVVLGDFVALGIYAVTVMALAAALFKKNLE